MTVIMIASSVSHPSGPMVGGHAVTPNWKMIEGDDPQWKMKADDCDEQASGRCSPGSSYSSLSEEPDWASLALADNIENVDISEWIGLLDDEDSYNMFAQLVESSNSADELEAELPLSGSKCASVDRLSSNATTVIVEHDYSLATYRPLPQGPVSRAASLTSGYSSGPECEEASRSPPVCRGAVSDNSSLSVNCVRSSSTTNMRSLLTEQTRKLLEKAAAGKLLSHSANVCQSSSESSSKSSSDVSRQPRKRKRAEETSSRLTSTIKKWSQLSGEEKQEALMQLTAVISKQLGLRERLEAIRIINPSSAVSPSDTECTIDMDLINDSRFNKLQRFVRRHADDFTMNSTRSSSQSQHSRLTSDYTINTAQGSSHGINNAQGSSGNPVPTGKRLTEDSDSDDAGKNIIIINEVDEKKKTEQLLKERYSGLFAFEVRVHCRAKEENDSEDIDILQ